MESERACEAPFSPFLVRSSASLRRRHFGGWRRRCSRGVTRKWKWREGRLCPPVSVSWKMSALKCPSLSSQLRARREASCLEVLLQLRWSFVRLSTSRGERGDTNNNVLKATGRSDGRLFRGLREKQSLLRSWMDRRCGGLGPVGVSSAARADFTLDKQTGPGPG